MPDMARHSSRSRLLSWLIGLVAVSLLAVVLTARTVLLGGVPEKANEDVLQEIEEFHSLADGGIDPETSEPFVSNTRLLEVFLSRQSPAKDESLVGIVDGEVMGLPSDMGRPLAAGDPLIQHAVESPMPSGVFVPEDGEPIHWGLVTVAGGEGSADVWLLIARYSDADYRKIAELIRVITWLSVGVLALSAFLAWLITGRLLLPIRRVSHQVAVDSRSGQATALAFNGTDEITELARAYNDSWVREHEVRAVNQSITSSAAREIRDAINNPEKLTTISNSLLALSRLAPGTRGIATAETDLGEVAREVDPRAAAVGGTAEVDRQSLVDALAAAALLLQPHTRQHVQAGAQVESSIARVWVRAADFVAREEQAAAMMSWPVHSICAAVVRTVADAHGGSVTVTAEYVSGTTIMLSLPAGGEHNDTNIDAEKDNAIKQ